MTEPGTGTNKMTPEQQRALLKKMLQKKSRKVLHAPASSAQRRLWFINKLEEPNPSYNIPCYVRLQGTLDTAILKKSMDEIVRRHAILRTRFEDSNGEPQQIIEPEIEIPVEVINLRDGVSVNADRQAALAKVLNEEMVFLFDLAAAPLLRVKLVQVSPDENVLILVMHHIISDGWSVRVLIAELLMVYAAFSKGQPSPLPALPIQYIDYSVAELKWLDSIECQRQLDYWTEKLAGLATLDIPTDNPRPLVKGYNGATYSFALDAAQSNRLRQLCKTENATLFMILQAAFSIFLHRYCDQDDIVFGSPAANRNSVENEKLIGFFVNVLLMRTVFSTDMTFVDVLKQVSENARGAYANQNIPFDKLVEVLQPERDPSRSPLFQVVFALQDEDIVQPDIENLVVSQPVVPGYDDSEFDIDVTMTRSDLELHLWDGEDCIRGTWVFDTGLFQLATITRMTAIFSRLVDAILENPGAEISTLAMLPQADADRVLLEWNRTATTSVKDSPVTIHSLFESRVKANPDAIAVEFEDIRLSYSELNAAANRLARTLLDHGVKTEMLVGVCLHRGIELVTAILAILKAGAAYVPLDPKYPESRIRYMVADSGLGVIVTDTAAAKVLQDYNGAFVFVDSDRDTIANRSDVNPDIPVLADNLAYVIYTSGSTGKPKGTMLEHSGLCKVAAEQVAYFSAGPGSRVLQFSSPNFDASLFDVSMALLTGGTLVLASQEAMQPGPPLVSVLREKQISILTIPPSSLSALSPEALPDLKVINVAGEACSAELVNRWASGRRFFNLYGPTEATIWTTATECFVNEPAPGIGRPIGSTTVYVLDRNAQPVPVGVPGELYIGGVGIARGYLNLPTMTTDRFVKDNFSPLAGGRLYRTGDKVRYRTDGTLEFLGRIDNQVKLRGFRIELGEIEAVLNKQSGVESCAVIMREDEPGNKRLAAYFVASENISIEALRSAMQDALPVHMVPAVYVRLPELPLTPNGKVDNRALPKPKPERQLEANYVAPETDLEATITGIWKQLLGVDEVGIDDNFFDLGGHSLLLVQLHEKINQLIEQDVAVVHLFQYPTVRTLAGYLLELNGDSSSVSNTNTDRSSAAGAGERGTCDEPIAIIGMAGRFPGAENVEQFWENLRDGAETITFFTREELEESGIDSDLMDNPGYVFAKGYLKDADMFDAQFFGFSPREAEMTDPQQRIFLETVWQALESAACDPERYPGQIGVFAGASMNTYQSSYGDISLRADAGDMQNAVGGNKDFLPTRVSYKLDLQGPSISIQTACSTSLVAVHQACRSILGNECDIAIAGGVSVGTPLKTGYIYEENSILSSDGYCRAFDADASGTLAGNGAGAVVLKRLSAAIADGDIIQAVIRGSAINNDGADKIGYTAPSIHGQVQVISKALQVADVDAASIGFIESHGTGTKLGDPIEIEALRQVYAGIEEKQSIAIGALKTNIGHMDAAAGIGALIKTVLSLKHQQIPPTLNFVKPRAELRLDDSPFYINAAVEKWVSKSTPRRAGISSFGIGGTNAHVILEEAPTHDVARHLADQKNLLIFSARNREALDASMSNLADALERQQSLQLSDVAYTLQVGRKRFDVRHTLVCNDRADAIERLRQGAQEVLRSDGKSAQKRVVFMFPGQGSQYISMAQDLYDSNDFFRMTVDECCDKLENELGCDLRDLMYPDDADKEASAQRLTQTQFAQPALFVMGYAYARLWMHWGIQPAAMIGHSIGEYVATCIAGVLSLDDALSLVVMRGRLMGALPTGSMLAVPLPADQVESYLSAEVSIATINSPDLTVVSGCDEAIEAVQKKLAESGLEGRMLHTSHAFHSPMMEPILKEFTEHVSQFTLHEPVIPYVSNVTGTWITREQAMAPDYYAKHLRHAVLFAQGLEELFVNADSILLEAGPGQVLCTLAKRHPLKPDTLTYYSSSRHPNQKSNDETFVLETLGNLWSAGLSPEWENVHLPVTPRRVVLPAYAFQRQRYWLESGHEEQTGNSLRKDKLAPSEWFYVPSWKRAGFSTGRVDERSRWLLFIDDSIFSKQLLSRLTAQGADIVCVRAGDSYQLLSTEQAVTQYQINPSTAEDYEKLLTALEKQQWRIQYVIHSWLFADTSGQYQQLGFYSLSYFAMAYAAVADNTDGENLHVSVVSTQVQDVYGNEVLLPHKATVAGPCQVIPVEYPQVKVCSIDLQPMANNSNEYPVRVVDAVIAETLDIVPDKTVVAYRGGYRWLRSVEPVKLDPKPDTAAAGNIIRHGGTCLITGGLGGIGLALAGHLAREYAMNLVLVARTPLPERSEWSSYLSAATTADSEIAQRIRQVFSLEQETGKEVLLCYADVADKAQMSEVILQAKKHFGVINGVIHAAGIPGGGIIQNLDSDKVEAVFSAKVSGTEVIDELLAGEPLDFFAIFSSLVTFIAMPGRVEYTAANAFVEAYAHSSDRAVQAPVTVINWDTWVDTGMAVSTHNAANGTNGLIDADEGISSEEGISAFVRALNSDSSQILVSVHDFDWQKQRLSIQTDTLPENEGVEESHAHPRPALSSEYQAPGTEAEKILVDIWSTILGIDKIGIHDNFFELGGDSVINIQITARANQAGLKLSPKQVFEYQTIAEVAAVAGTATLLEAEQGLVTGSVPLTPIQRWFLDQDQKNPHHFNLSTLLQTEQVIDTDALVAAIDVLLKHHDALRLHYQHETDGVWTQTIAAPLDESIVQNYDLSRLDADMQREQLGIIGDALQKSLNLNTGSLMKVASFNMGESPSKLLLVFHHLIMDVISWRIVIEDLNTLYAAISEGRQYSLPDKTASFKQWSLALQNYARSEQAEAELSYWQQVAASSPAVLPVDLNEDMLVSRERAAGNTIASSKNITRYLDEEETRMLVTDVPASFGVSINDLMLWALSQALNGWTGQSLVAIDVEGHGREAILEGLDPSRTVGWFTSLYPVVLELPETDIRRQLKSVHEQYTAIPDNGIGFGLLRYLNQSETVKEVICQVAVPEVSFLYLGQTDQTASDGMLFQQSADFAGQAHDPEMQRAHLLEVNSMVTQGKYTVVITYSQNYHKSETIEKLADAFIDSLRQVIAECNQTDTDEISFTDISDDLSDADLEEILRQQE